MKFRPLTCLLATMTLLPQAMGDESPRRRVIEQKSALVQRVLADSPLARRIATGGDDQARRYLAEAAAQHLRAQALAAEGRIQASEAAIDAAMALIGKARQLSPDRNQMQSEQQGRYAALRDSTQGLLAAARRHATRKPGEVEPPELSRGAGLVEEARGAADAGRFDDAQRALLGAERELLAGLARMLGSATLDYTLRFDTPAEEYRHETARFDSFRRLVPVALAGLKPAPDATRLAQQYAQRGLQLQNAAEQQSARGEMRAALETLREAIEWLQRALAAAGLVMQPSH